MKGFCLEVTGPFACFTRPEMKVERVSYDVITPSAARAVFEAILWKPAIRWRVTKVEVLAPIKWVSVRRNEVGAVMSSRDGMFIEDKRQQRAGLFLRDVKYRLRGEFKFLPPGERTQAHNPVPEHLWDREEIADGMAGPRRDDKPEKYAAMFARRAAKGQCFNQPYLGCREFAAAYRLVDPEKEPTTPPSELLGVRDLGWMLYDLDYTDRDDPQPLFFRATLENGVMLIPDRNNREEVRG